MTRYTVFIEEAWHRITPIEVTAATPGDAEAQALSGYETADDISALTLISAEAACVYDVQPGEVPTDSPLANAPLTRRPRNAAEVRQAIAEFEAWDRANHSSTDDVDVDAWVELFVKNRR